MLNNYKVELLAASKKMISEKKIIERVFNSEFKEEALLNYNSMNRYRQYDYSHNSRF